MNQPWSGMSISKANQPPQNRALKWLLLILFLLIIALGGYYYWYRYYREADDGSAVTASPSITLSPSSQGSPTSLPSASTDWKHYINQTYDFGLTMTDEWKGFMVDIARATDPAANAYLYFWVPNADPNAQKTDKPGYINPVILSVYTQAGWDQAQLEEGPKPSVLGRSGNYIVSFSTWQDCPLSDVATCTNLNTTWRNNIVPSFKSL